MIVLDTNIVSEFMGTPPSGNVVKWLDDQPRFHIHLASMTMAEIHAGLAAMPVGKRRTALTSDYNAFRARLPVEQILSFDEAAAIEYGNILAARKSQGRPIKVIDAQIASVCIAHGFDLATRNTKDFEGVGLTLINPFEHPV